MFELNSFLRKIKLIENFTIEVAVSKDDFKRKLQDHLYQDRTGFFGNSYSSKSHFKGKVKKNKFSIEKDLYSNDKIRVRAYGSFVETKDKTKIDVEVRGLDPFMKFWFGMLIIFMLIPFLFESTTKNAIGARLSILIFVMFGFVSTYYTMRKAMRKMKYDMEQEFYYLTKEQQ